MTDLFDRPVIKEFRAETRWLSNFAEVVVYLEDRIAYPTTEHAYQAAKFSSGDRTQPHSPHRIEVATQRTPHLAKKRAYELQEFWNTDVNWDDIKNAVMLDLLRQKYTQEPYRQKLLDTHDAILEEGNSWGDVYWGKDLKTGKGLNWLGRLTMQVRDELVQEEINGRRSTD